MRYKWEADKKVSGLAVRVSPTGGRSFHFRWGPRGRWTRSMKLGGCDELTLKAARQRATELRLLVAQGGDPGADRQQLRDSPRLVDLQHRYMEEWAKRRKKSWKNDDGYWRNHIMQAPFAKLRVQDITAGDIASWHSWHPQPVTANRALECLSKAMTLAKRWGWIDANPCEGIESNGETVRRRYATADELRRIAEQIQHDKTLLPLQFRFACLVELLLLTGARLSELMTANWAQVDWARGVLTLTAHKTDRWGHRDLYLSQAAMRVLDQLRNHEEPGEHLIRGKGTGPLVGYRRMWLRMCERAEVEDLRIHDLRHTFASLLVSNGQTLGAIGELLGHRSSQTTSRYAHLIDDAARAAVEAVSGLIPQPGESGGRHTSAPCGDPQPRSWPSSATGTESQTRCNVLPFRRGR